MKQLFVTALCLFLSLGATPAPRAQSGRKRTPPAVVDRNADHNKSGQPADETNAPGPAAEIEEEADEVVRVDSTLVTVPVSVRDRQGRYAPDLRRQDFHIFEEGVEQKIAYFATVDQPFTVALVLDTSSSTDFRLEDMQAAAIAFVSRLKPEDRVLVVNFDDSIDVLSEATSDRDQLTKAIRRARSGGGTRLYDAVDFVIKKKLKGVTGRKAVVLFTDGVDTTSHRASYNSTVRQAEELDALIYPVSYASFGRGLRGITPPTFPSPGGGGGVIFGSPFPGSGGGNSGGSRAEYELGESYLKELAFKTGGRFYRGDSLSNITQAFEWVAEELRRQYSLGYYPKTAAQDGQRRRIRVTVNRPELVVLSRDSYIFTRDKTADKEAGRQPKDAEAPPRNLVGLR